jgi:hypothetical protein
MEVDISELDRDALLRETVAKVGPNELKAALDLATQPGYQPPKAVHNALLALRRHHDPASYLTRTQYRPTVPYLAAALSDKCLTRTIEVLGDHSEDPTRDQLAEALDTVRPDFADPVIAVMLAGVAHDELPSSDLCVELLATDPRYGLTTDIPQPATDQPAQQQPVTGQPATQPSEPPEGDDGASHQGAEPPA